MDARIPGVPAPDEATLLSVRGLETCANEPWTGDAAVSLLLRPTLFDGDCPGGLCTLPDLEVRHQVRCRAGDCRTGRRRDGSSPGLLPADMPWSAELLALRVLDGLGRPVLSPTLTLKGTGARRYEARLVPVYPACAALRTDSTSNGGAPACAAVRPVSDCAGEPATALRSGEGRSKLKLYAGSGGSVGFYLKLARLFDCTGTPYEGTVALAVTARVVVENPSGAGSTCTTVDTVLGADVPVSGGYGRGRGTLTVVPGANAVSLEVLRVEIRDAGDQPVLAGPGLSVSCKRSGVCYGR